MSVFGLCISLSPKQRVAWILVNTWTDLKENCELNVYKMWILLGRIVSWMFMKRGHYFQWDAMRWDGVSAMVKAQDWKCLGEGWMAGFISDRGSHFTVLLVGFEWLVNCCLIPSLCCCKEDVVLSVGAFLPEVFTRRSNTSRERVSPLPLIFWRVTLPHSCFTVDSMAFLLSAMWIIGHANRSPQFRTLTFQVCLRNVKNCTFYKIDVRFV